MPVHYTVAGYFALPTSKNEQGTKRIDDNVKDTFLDSEFANRRGCYVFAMRTGHGAIVPHYVGQTSATFSSECFTAHKLNKYNDALHSDSHGTPMLFFVEAPISTGPLNHRALNALEDYLIGLGFQRNPQLRNIKGKGNIEPPFAIDGVHTPKKGKPSAKLTMFRRMLGIKK